MTISTTVALLVFVGVVVSVVLARWGGPLFRRTGSTPGLPPIQTKTRVTVTAVLVMTTLVVVMVFVAAPTNTLEFIREYWQAMTLLVLAGMFRGLGRHFEKTLYRGYVPTYIGSALSIVCFVLCLYTLWAK